MENKPKRNRFLAILCDFFGMVNWPFQRWSDLQLDDEKVTFESPGYSILAID